MTKHPANRWHVPKLVGIGIWTAGVVGLLSIARMIVIAVDKVQTGHGLDTYRTFWLVEFNWIGFLIFLVVGAVALLVGAMFRLKEWREVRKLEAKYGEKRHG